MNVARHLVQQGEQVTFASRVGTDASGEQLVEFLKSGGLFSALIQRDDQLPTCEVTVQLDVHGHATYIIPEPVSWDNILPDALLDKAASDASAIIYGSLACRGPVTRSTLLALLEKTGALKVFDVNLRAPHYTTETIGQLMAHADVVKMNDDEAALLMPEGVTLEQKIVAFRQQCNAKVICVTRGGDGAIVWHDGSFYEHPGFKVNVVDTVGAGDSFLAAFISGLLKQQPMPQVLEKACRIGAFVAGQRGANPIYPERLI